MLAQMKELFARHPKTTIIWAHLGLGRIVRPLKEQAAIVEKVCTDPDLRHVYMDISWDEVAKYATATPEATQRTADVINRYPDRFLFGTDEVAPKEQASYMKVYDMYAPLFEKLTPEASEKLRKGNYERLFDEARRKRAGVGAGQWELIARDEGGRCRRRRESTRGQGGSGEENEGHQQPEPCRRLADRGVAGAGDAGPGASRGGRGGAGADADPDAGRHGTGLDRPGRARAPDGHLRRGNARHGLPVGPERPELVRRGAAHQAAGLRERVRRGRPLLRRCAPEPPRGEGLCAHEAGRAQDDLRVRALRGGRRRRADDLPPAPRLGRARPDRRRPDLEPVHGHRRLPELHRVLGAECHGVLPQRPVPLDPVAGRRLEFHGRARAAGRERRPGRATTRPSRCRASRHASPCRTSRPTSATRRAGATCRSRASSAGSSGTT